MAGHGCYELSQDCPKGRSVELSSRLILAEMPELNQTEPAKTRHNAKRHTVISDSVTQQQINSFVYFTKQRTTMRQSYKNLELYKLELSCVINSEFKFL
ncbi:hypothetical protein T4B_9388 [Trichinella pseudospiralis]|uniref:Uncharacterized protein n=1 Tax=Trichinella pseudospiralis TaxID=6337 RepID=A0A0V1IHG2_TRIPS|nr:hypothetical protein T4B_9388 [Trichinella pseudospiralis]KRZ39807.1 hypothetical protein T4C_26 [Trichinella pseudospiralis]